MIVVLQVHPPLWGPNSPWSTILASKVPFLENGETCPSSSSRTCTYTRRSSGLMEQGNSDIKAHCISLENKNLILLGSSSRQNSQTCRLFCEIFGQTLKSTMWFSSLLISSLAASSTLAFILPPHLTNKTEVRGFDISAPQTSTFWSCAKKSGYGRVAIRGYQQLCGSVCFPVLVLLLFQMLTDSEPGRRGR